MNASIVRWAVVNVGIALTLTGCRSESSSTPAPRPDAQTEKADAPGISGSTLRIDREMLRDLRITTSKVEEHRGGESASLLGELGVNQNAYAEVSAPLQARVISLRAVEGQRVGTGDVLATLESGELAKARGELATAQARRDLAQRAADRKRSLNNEQIVPTREVQEAENEVIAADAQVRAAQASLRSLGAPDQAGDGASASTLMLRSPISGVILERTIALGQTADPSKPLFRIGDVSTLWLTVHAFERDAVRLAKGAPARITFAAIPGRTFQGSVALIGQSVDPDSRTVAVRIDLSNRDGMLRPGMSATAWLPVGEQGTLLAVPAAAVQRVRDRWCVFIPKDDRTFEIRPIGRGRDIAGEVEILSGVRAGEPIVVDGAFLLKAETERSAAEGEHGEKRE
ncbi:MAG TPA: efflux RND transporter periplasmic adaptor subunit [Vicinamibacterales bacterium]|jgi:cobalt-zinc-cadmium efflux system membrane fusion protein